EVNLFFGVLRHHIFGLIILSGVLIWLASRPRRRMLRPWGLGLLALWLGFNLFTVNWRFNLEKNEPANPFSGNGVTQFLQANLFQNSPLELPPGRVVSGGLLPGGNSAASVYNLPDLTGNTPLQLAASQQFFDTMPAWRLWQLMSVRYVVDERDIADEGLTPVFDDEQLRVFEMGDPFPWAWFVSRVEVIADVEQTIDRLAADVFDLRRAVIVAEPLAANLEVPEDGGSTVEIKALTPTSFQAEVSTSTEQLLVVSQIYYPGWRARLNDQPVDLVRANEVLQGVVIPPGRHRLDLNFWPASFLWGSGISIGGFLLWVGLLILLKKKRNKVGFRVDP
ncbi:MAG: YfhO family protein, partial [Anaerolineae bacterium]|nr:YfhO family protein [Anaerolineae bacterium]